MTSQEFKLSHTLTLLGLRRALAREISNVVFWGPKVMSMRKQRVVML